MCFCLSSSCLSPHPFGEGKFLGDAEQEPDTPGAAARPLAEQERFPSALQMLLQQVLGENYSSS